jgi:hypothetical protein
MFPNKKVGSSNHSSCMLFEQYSWTHEGFWPQETGKVIRRTKVLYCLSGTPDATGEDGVISLAGTNGDSCIIVPKKRRKVCLINRFFDLEFFCMSF